MAQVDFDYKGITYSIHCQEDQKMSDICSNFLIQSKLKENQIIFLYEGNAGEKFDKNLKFNQMANPSDKANKKMIVLVLDNEGENGNKSKIKSKDVICPECNENIKMSIKNNMIYLFGCKNNHKINNISLKDFERTQIIDLRNIKCGVCKENNKSTTAKNEFYKCYECNINLCPQCKAQHNNTHNIYDYDKINYLCLKHNQSFNSFCKTCNMNICNLCEKDHSEHEILVFGQIIKDKNEILPKLEELKNSLDTFNNNINKIFEIINSIKSNIEHCYKLEEYLINNYNKTKTNYQVIYNINEIINYNNTIIKNINNLNNETKLENKFNKILSMYNQNNINENNEIKLIVKIEKEDINKQIYFLDNTNGDLYINGNWEKHYHDFLQELNDSNVELFINNKKYKYQKYFVPEKEGKYEIILKFNIILKDCSFMFYNCNNLINIDLSTFDTKGVINLGGMFYGCSNLTKIDLSSFNTLNVTNMGGMFYNCSKLEKIDLSSFCTKNVTTMGGMFLGCSKLTFINLSSFDTKNVTDMNGMFYNCFNLEMIDLSVFDTKNVTNMSYMFYKCSKLKNMNLSSFDTKNVTDMNGMFYGCSNLTSINLSSFNTKNVTNMNSMFHRCSNLTSLDLSSFNTRNVTNMGGMFDACFKLVEIKLNKNSYEKIKFYLNEDDVNIIV